jgi:hypothetical protein
MVTTIKLSRLRWTGHVMRMQDNLPCKKITLDKPEGRRRAGRSNLRWIDGVTKDAEKLRVRNWRARARYRDDWRWLLDGQDPAWVVAPRSECVSDFRINTKYQISRKSVHWEPICSVRTDEHREKTELPVAVRNFANAPKKKGSRKYFLSHVIVQQTKWPNLASSISTERSVANKRKCMIS